MPSSDYRYIKVLRENEIARVILCRPTANEIFPEFMNEIADVHCNLSEEQDIKAVLLTSEIENYFCNGLDPEYMLAQSPQGRLDVFDNFSKMICTVYCFPKPHFSIMEGHAIAGGAILSMTSDFRYMADRRFRFSFSEAAVGITIPKVFMRLVRETLHPSAMRQALMQAYFYLPKEALSVGLVDAVCPPNEVYAAAQKHVYQLLRHSFESLVSIKKNMREENSEAFKRLQKESVENLKPFIGHGSHFEKIMGKLVKRKNR